MLFFQADLIDSSTISSFFNDDLWPVTETEYKILADSLINNYLELIEDVDAEVADILAADSRYLITIINTIHYNISNNRSRKKSTPDSNLSNEVFSIEALTSSKELVNLQYNWGKTAKGLARTIFTTIRKRSELGTNIFPLQGRDTLLAIGFPDDPLRCEYLAQRDSHVIWCDDLPFYLAGQAGESTRLGATLDDVVGRLIGIVSKFPVEFTDGIDFDLLRHHWNWRLNRLMNIYRHAQKYLKNSIDELHVFGTGNILRKTCALSWIREGIPTFAYNHGNDIGFSIQKNTFLLEERLWPSIISPTPAIVNNKLDNYYNIGHSRQFPQCKYISANVDYYEALVDAHNKCGFSRRKQRILLMGYPMTNARMLDGVGEFFYYRMPLELSIIRDIIGQGYRVSYKMHPGRVIPFRGILENMGVTVITEPFEYLHQEYDQYIFTTSSSTTFGFAITTNRPIILLLHGKDRINQNVVKNIRSRINIVPIDWEDEYHLSYSSNQLLRALEQGRDQAVTKEFAMKYLYSSTS